jgi:glycosyltransferase involved in cell wall biosynthesis
MTTVAFLQASLPVGGAERLVQSLMAGLDRGRFSTVAINLYAPGPIGEQLAAAGHAVVGGLARGRIDPRAAGRLDRALEERGAAVVYVADSALPLFWAGWRRRRHARPRLVVGFHSTGKSSDWLQHRVAGGCAFPVADRFVALAPGHRAFLCDRFRLDPARFTVIANGVDTARFHPAEDPMAARRAAGLGERERHVGIVAALRPEKHHSLFLRMARQVAARVPEARFLVAGEGPERGRLEAEAAALGLGDRVRFLGARQDVPELVRALDVAVLCSRPVIETFPMALLEALASGVPVASTRVGSVADVVTDEATGFLVPPGDVAALAAAVARLLGDDGLRERMGRAARADAERRFALSAMVEAYARLFEDLGA